MTTHIFTPITDRFGYGKYLDLEIVIDNNTKYINATKLCQLGNRRLKKWLENATSKELLSYYTDVYEPGPNSDQVGISYEVKQEDVKGISKKDQETIVGTYFYRKLIVHIAQWISPAFAMKVSEIVDDYNDRQNRSLLREKDDKIDELMKKLEAMDKRAIDTKETIDDMKDMMTDMRSDIRRMRRHLDNAEVKEDKREGILVYRLEHDDMDTIRIRCGTSSHLAKFINKARWYREYDLISNAKRALNYMKDNGYLTKQVDTKYELPNKDQRVKLLKMLKKVNDSYK